MIGTYTKKDFMELVNLPAEIHDVRLSTPLYIFVVELTCSEGVSFTQTEVDDLLCSKNIYVEDFFSILKLSRLHINAKENPHITLLNQIINSENQDTLSVKRKDEIKSNAYLLHISDLYQDNKFFPTQKMYHNNNLAINITDVPREELINYYVRAFDNYERRSMTFNDFAQRTYFEKANPENQKIITDIFSQIRPSSFDVITNDIHNFATKDKDSTLVLKKLYIFAVVTQQQELFRSISENYHKNKQINMIQVEQMLLNHSIAKIPEHKSNNINRI